MKDFEQLSPEEGEKEEEEKAPEQIGWWRPILGGHIAALTPEACTTDSGKVTLLLSISEV